MTPTSSEKFPNSLPCELARNQELIWIGQQLNPSLPLYEMCYAFDISGEVDVACFQSAFRKWIAATAVLRTVSVDEVWTSAVTTGSPKVGCDFEDVSDSGNPDQAARQFARQRMQQSFQPTLALYDSILLRLNSHRYRWLFRIHHILTDGLNTGLLLKSMSDWYASELSGGPPASQPEYCQFVEGERASVVTPQFREHCKWWETRTAECSGSRFYSGAVRKGSTQHVRNCTSLTKAENELLNELASAAPFRQFTPALTHFNIFATALTALMARVEQRPKICFGATSHGRANATFRETPGLFMQLMPFQVEVSDDETFGSLSSSVATETRGFLQHAVPGVMQSEALKAFDVALNILDLSVCDFSGMPASVEWLHNGYGDPERRLAISAYQRGNSGEWQLIFDFNDGVFSDAARARFIAHFRNVLRAMATDQEANVSTFGLLTAEENRDLTAPRTHRPLPDTPNVWNRFERIEASVPDRIAVEFANERLTYAELGSAVRQLARSIDGAGCGPLVPLLCRRDANAVVGLLGILAAGRCFLPVDLSQPRQRIDSLLQDCASDHVVDASSQPVLRASGVAPGPPCPLTVGACYVLYTSGSTGRPNGVVVGHESVLNLLTELEQRAAIDGGRCSWWTNVGFDVAMYEVLSALLFGRTLCIPDDAVRNSPPDLFAWLCRKNIDSAYLPPFLLRDFHDFVARSQECGLQRLLVGVEPISQRLLTSISTVLPRLTIINGYGPTEATICATLMTIDRTDDSSDRASIGQAVSGNVLRVVDRNGELVPSGVAGELLIGGTGLARGYLRQPELTVSRFVTDINDDRASVWYRTGDRVRWKEDGNLQFLGRFDSQIKIRGYRIEPSEIEAALAEVPNVGMCIVEVVSSPDNDPHSEHQARLHLTAYFTSPNTIPAKEIRDSLRLRIPEYMIPSAIVQLPAFPTTASGKLDRRALSESAPTPQGSESDFVSPRNEVEQKLVEIWSDVLGVEVIGIRDNFHQLGGDSILAIQVVVRANQAGLKLSPWQVFESPTVEALAQVCGEVLTNEFDQGPVSGPTILTPIQRWFFEQNLTVYHHWNQVFHAELAYDVDPDLMAEALQQISRHHDALQLRFSNVRGEWKAEIETENAQPILKVHHVDDSNESSRHRFIDGIQADLNNSLNLTHGPLCGAALLTYSAGPPELIVAIHHLAVDAVSWGILLADLSIAYEQLLSGAKLTLPGRTASIQRWSESLFEHANSGELDEELDIWRDMLTTSAVRLPVDRPLEHDENGSAGDSAETLTVQLSRDQTSALFEQLPKTCRSRVDEVLNTAVCMTLSDWTSSRSVRFDQERHGRERLNSGVDVSRTVGWFTSLVPVVVTLPQTTDPETILSSVKDRIRSIPNQGIGYGMLRYLHPSRDVRRQMVGDGHSEVLFNFLGHVEQLVPQDSIFVNGKLQLSRSPTSRRPYLLEINAAVVDDSLTIDWTFCNRSHNQATIQSVAESFLSHLQTLTDYCLCNQESNFAVADLPLANLDQAKLNKLSVLLQRADQSRETVR